MDPILHTFMNGRAVGVMGDSVDRDHVRTYAATCILPVYLGDETIRNLHRRSSTSARFQEANTLRSGGITGLAPYLPEVSLPPRRGSDLCWRGYSILSVVQPPAGLSCITSVSVLFAAL